MQPSDRDLWDQAGAGSGAAFGQLFDRHARAVYNHCFRLSASTLPPEQRFAVKPGHVVH